jgi:hypothetical protein
MRRLAGRLERAGVSTWLGNPPNLGRDVRARTVVKNPGISFDVPLLEQARELDLIVCETSSFQLEGCEHLLSEIAIFTNLTADHVGRHRTIARYGEAKRRLFVRAGSVVPQAIVDIDDPHGVGVAPGQLVTRCRVAGDHDVARAGQLVGPEYPDALPAGILGHRPAPRRVDRNVVAEPVQLPGDGQRIGLAPGEPLETLVAQHDAHDGSGDGIRAPGVAASLTLSTCGSPAARSPPTSSTRRATPR